MYWMLKKKKRKENSVCSFFLLIDTHAVCHLMFDKLQKSNDFLYKYYSMIQKPQTKLKKKWICVDKSKRSKKEYTMISRTKKSVLCKISFLY